MEQQRYLRNRDNVIFLWEKSLAEQVGFVECDARGNFIQKSEPPIELTAEPEPVVELEAEEEGQKKALEMPKKRGRPPKATK